MRPRPATIYLTLTALLVAIGLSAWLLSSAAELHDRFAQHSRGLGFAFLIVLSFCWRSALSGLAACSGRPRASSSPAVRAPDDMIQAAAVQAEQAGEVIRQVADESARAGLNRELSEIQAGRKRREFHVVVFGTGSAGKTSLINALTRPTKPARPSRRSGRPSRRRTIPTRWRASRGPFILTDTPGLSEMGEAGSEREREARDLAARADLLVFVLDHDLIRTEYEPLGGPGPPGKAFDRRSQQDRPVHRHRRRRHPREAQGTPARAGAGRRHRRRRRRPAAVPGPRASGLTVRSRPCSRSSHPISTALAGRIGHDPPPRRRHASRRQPLAPRRSPEPQGPGPARQGTRRAGQGRDREVPVDHRRYGLRQSVPGARAGGQRGRPVPDDLGAGRRLRRPDLDVARPDDRRPDDPDALEARPGRDGHIADRRDLQVDTGRLRGRAAACRPSRWPI